MAEQPQFDLDLDPYQSLLTETFGDQTSISLFDHDRNLRLHSGIGLQSVTEPRRSSFECPLTSISGVSLGWIEIEGPTTNIDNSDIPRLMAELIRREFLQGIELDDLATELGTRYEELNLIYHTEDKVSLFRDGQVALDKLVNNCCDYLDVSMAALILRDHGTEFAHVNPSSRLHDHACVLQELNGAFYDWVFDSSEPLVINEPAEQRAINLTNGLPLRLLATAVANDGGDPIGILLTANDCGKRPFSNGDKNLLSVMARKASKIIQSSYDTLTGTINRAGFEHFVEIALGLCKTEKRESTLLFLDVDNLHVINDAASYQAGDEALKSISHAIRQQLRETDVLSRLGGDRFGVLLQPCSGRFLPSVAEKIRQAIFSVESPDTGLGLAISASIGAVEISSHMDGASAAIAAAELTCGMAKEKGGNTVEVYRSEDSELAQRRRHMQTVGIIQRALNENRFRLFAQPIVPVVGVASGNHYEILLRYEAEDGSIQPPAMFMPAAERYFLMPELDRWVISNTLTQVASVGDQITAACCVSINISGQSFVNPEFLDFVRDEISGSGVSPSNICFEITETAAIHDLTEAQHFITQLKALGCKFSLDDFGAGLSSFAYLRDLDVDYLKIDGELVKDLPNDKAMVAMVQAINQVGHAMSLKTIAEYVENQAILSCLAGIGVDYAQGYGIARPTPFLELIANQNKPVQAAV